MKTIAQLALLALADALCAAHNFDSRNFGGRVKKGYGKDGASTTVPTDATDAAKKEWNTKHLPHTRTVESLAKLSNTSYDKLSSSLEEYRLECKREADEAERREKANQKGGAKADPAHDVNGEPAKASPATVKPAESTAKAEMKAAIAETKKELEKKAA